MGSYVVKCSPDEDVYVYWSGIADDVHCIGDRPYVAAYMRSIGDSATPDRFERADATGTSSRPGYYNWDSPGFVAAQRGWLPRERLKEYATLRCAQDEAAWSLLTPFDA